MKNLFVGLVIGAGAAWLYFINTAGKIHITETMVVTNTVIDDLTQTERKIK